MVSTDHVVSTFCGPKKKYPSLETVTTFVGVATRSEMTIFNGHYNQFLGLKTCKVDLKDEVITI